MPVYVSQVMLLIFLFGAAASDARKKKISLIYILAGLAAGAALTIFTKEISIWEMLSGCAFGVAMMLVSKLSREAIGYGDSLMLAATGAFLGLIKNLIMFFLALIIAVCAAAVLYLKKKRKKELAFIPFMLGGYIAMLAMFS